MDERMTPPVDCIGLALDLEQQAERVESQTAQRAMQAAATAHRRIDAHLAQPAQAVAATDAEIAEWAERHDLNFGGSKTDARDAFEDAESHHRTRAIGSAQAEDVRVVYELFQDGDWVAGSDDLSDALHYVSQYSQDGPVELRKVTCHSEIIDTAALTEKGNG